MKKITSQIFVLTALISLSCCSTSSFFYAPLADLRYSPDTATYRVEDVSFQATDGKILNGWLLKPRSGEAIATVLHLHGNGGNISYQFQFAEPLVRAGFQVMVFDYEGYGRSQGKPSQERVLDDAIAALHYVRCREDAKNKKLILFGQSLGGHLSCVVAAREQGLIDALVVEGAFTGHELMAEYVGRRYHCPRWTARMLVQSRYDAISYIDKVTIPKLIIHSTEDGTCPFFMGRQLFEKAVAPKEFWEIKGPHIQAAFLYKKEFAQKFLALIN